MTMRRRSSSVGVMSPCRLGSTSSAIKTESRNTSWLNDFTVESTIGRGKFAVVKKCTEKSTGRKFAAKCIRKRRHNRDCCPDIFHEIAVLEISSKHPYLIDLYRVYETSSEVVLILEYAAGGEIFDHCVGVKDTFTEAMSRRLLMQILQGVAFLHSNDIVHLDLKPQNILLTKEGTDPDANIKLVDFGLSKYITNGLEVREILGTPDYVAPEVLNYEPISTATDVWSLGVVSYVMLTGVSPFLGDTKQETLMNVTTAALEFPPDLFNNLSPACQDMIHKMLQRDPSDRLSAKDSLSHPWISGIISPSPAVCIKFSEKGAGSSDEDVFAREESKLTNVDSGIESPCNDKHKDDSHTSRAQERDGEEHQETITSNFDDTGLDVNGNKDSNEVSRTETSRKDAVTDADLSSLEDISEYDPNDKGQKDALEATATGAVRGLDIGVAPNRSNIDFNGNIVSHSTESQNVSDSPADAKNGMPDSLEHLSQAKFRLSSEGEYMHIPGTCVTGTNFANVKHQDPILPVEQTAPPSNSTNVDQTTSTSSCDTDCSLGCFERTCCSILPCAKSAVYFMQGVNPGTGTTATGRQLGRRESNKENFDARVCEKQSPKTAAKSQPGVEAKEHTASPSPRLTRLTLSPCINSTLGGVVHSSDDDSSLNESTQETVPPLVPTFNAFNLTVHIPIPFSRGVHPHGGGVSRSDHHNPVFTPASITTLPPHDKESSPPSRGADPSLKRRKFDYCKPTDQNQTEIPVAD